ncbi:MAG: glycosyltransferase family protein [Pseudomonadota bacterium]|nr:glycosyltransferase family protein [Pseudomonadota bacterium]
MKILYGVQGTGNGHVSRANAMFEAFKAHPELDVTWLLSGRPRAQGCGVIPDFTWRRGLSFVPGDGGIRKLATLRQNNVLQFLYDVHELDLAPYDLVVSDYEPVVSHAARRWGLPVVGIGHLYAFQYPVPMRGGNPFTTAILRKFAPATINVGLHWHHFDAPLLPPILDLHKPDVPQAVVRNKVLVYLPWENAQGVLDMLAPIGDYEFYVYHPQFTDADIGHVHKRALSRTGFKQDLHTAHCVIANCGFESISECLHLGKRVLTKPLRGQMEQDSNAAALEQLGYADTATQLDTRRVKAWLEADTPAVRIEFPDVACELASWIARGRTQSLDSLSAWLWSATRVMQAPMMDCRPAAAMS